MSEAYIFSIAALAGPEEALRAALHSTGLSRRVLAELTWLGPAPLDIPGDFPLIALDNTPAQTHLSLQSLLRRLLAGERGLFAFGQTHADRSFCLLFGGPSAVGRLNLLPVFRLVPIPPLSADPAAAAATVEAFRLSLTPPPILPEPPSEDAPPLIISPAAPPPAPLTVLPPPEIHYLLAEGIPSVDIFPDARRLPASYGLPALLDLFAALTGDESGGALVTPLARGSLLTLVERL